MSLINCPECNNQVSDQAPLCMKCGYPLPNFKNLFGGIAVNAAPVPIKPQGALTKAQCTNCNAMLEVDASLNSATCPFCNTPYIVEQAINNYNINIASNNMNISNATINVAGDGHTVENYIRRAEEYFDNGDIKTAKSYLNKALDIDSQNQKVKDLLEKYIDYEKQAHIDIEARPKSGGWPGRLISYDNRVEFVNQKGGRFVYNYNSIGELSARGTYLTIACDGKKVIFEVMNAQAAANSLYYSLDLWKKYNR